MVTLYSVTMTSQKCKILGETPLGSFGVQTEDGVIAIPEPHHQTMAVFTGRAALTV